MHKLGLTRRAAISGGLGLAAAVALEHTHSFGAGPATVDPPKRMPITLMSPRKLALLKATVAEMMDRSQKNPADPRGWIANAEPHRNFCTTPGFGGAQQVHLCHWFLPWHRAYLSVTERKLREISGDQSLAIPYWNWTIERMIPAPYLEPGSSLSRSKRFTEDRPLTDDEVDYIRLDPVLCALGVGALSASKFIAIEDANPVALASELATSIGGVVRPNALGIYRSTRLERSPHGSVHVYVGGVSAAGDEIGDMGDFATAALDPLFFAHHCNLDRIWEIWRQTASNLATEPKNEEFLEHRFVFPWLDGSSIEVPVKDTLCTTILGYSYDSLEVIPADAASRQAPEEYMAWLPPIVNAELSVPAILKWATPSTSRIFLVLEDIESPGRPLTAGVYLMSQSAGDTRRFLLGNISVVRQGQGFQAPGTIIFDATAAINALDTRNLRVVVIPNAIGGETTTPYPALHVGAIHLS